MVLTRYITSITPQRRDQYHGYSQAHNRGFGVPCWESWTPLVQPNSGQGYTWPLVGTAFDYAIRYFIALQKLALGQYHKL